MVEGDAMMKRPASRPCASRSRPALILIAVLVVVSLAALTGASATYMAQAEVQSASGSLRRVQSRALAWSGVQAVMAELAEQREAILRGEPAQLTQEWELFADSSGRRAVVRIVPGISGEPLASEQSRLDLNLATAEMLIAAGFDEQIAAAIVAARDRQPLESVAELLGIEGITPEILFGEGWEDPASSDESGLRADRAATGELFGAGPAPSLADMLTVFSFDPNVQAGLGPGGDAHRGRLRININTPWSDRLGRAVEERFGKPAADAAGAIMRGGTKIETLGALIQLASLNNADSRILPILLDTFTVVNAEYLRGVVDMNTAPAEVLACIPGISSDAAAQIVEARSQISLDSRQSILWPLTEGILGSSEMGRAADYLTTRSCQWRVVVEGGFIPAGDRSSWEDLGTDALQDRIVLEAVIDIASERPRVAYLRDVTLRAVANRLAADIGQAPEADLPTIVDEPAPLEFWPEPPRAGGFGDWPGRNMPSARTPEVAAQGPIEPDADEGGTMAGDQRIGRWTPGPARKEEGR
jgi:DNA uptake protein ComE-like DNA-binding protein